MTLQIKVDELSTRLPEVFQKACALKEDVDIFDGPDHIATARPLPEPAELEVDDPFPHFTWLEIKISSVGDDFRNAMENGDSIMVVDALHPSTGEFILDGKPRVVMTITPSGERFLDATIAGGPPIF